jgi:ABC-type cobalamin transport system permease subunit
MRRFLRGLGELALEFAGECGLAGAAVGLALAVRWGWSRHRASTATVLAVVVALTAYGVTEVVRRARGRTRRGLLAGVAVGVAVAVAVWLYYLAVVATA